jgi:hypothetical protein
LWERALPAKGRVCRPVGFQSGLEDGLTYFRSRACSRSLRDAFGACSPFRWNRVAHMGLVGRGGIVILNKKKGHPNGVALFFYLRA